MQLNKQYNMFTYTFFIALIILNLVFFSLFLKFAKKIGFVDKSMKFKNPITLTSAGIIIYFNLIILFIIHIFLEDNFIKNLPNNFFVTITCLNCHLSNIHF